VVEGEEADIFRQFEVRATFLLRAPMKETTAVNAKITKWIDAHGRPVHAENIRDDQNQHRVHRKESTKEREKGEEEAEVRVAVEAIQGGK
jgi:hypothetical protein